MTPELNLVSMSRDAGAPVVDACPIEEKSPIPAGTGVNDDRVGPYVLQVALRAWPSLSLNGHRREARERLRKQRSEYIFDLLEVHDK